MGGWISTYASNQGFDTRDASMVLSSFWIGLMIARLIASAVITPANGILTLAAMSVSAMIHIALMIASNSKRVAALLVFATGLCFGPIFPTVVGVTFSKLDTSLYGSAFGIIFAVGLPGASTLPAAIGMYSKGKPIKKSFPIAIGAAFVMFALAILFGRVSLRKDDTPAAMEGTGMAAIISQMAEIEKAQSVTLECHKSAKIEFERRFISLFCDNMLSNFRLRRSDFDLGSEKERPFSTGCFYTEYHGRKAE